MTDNDFSKALEQCQKNDNCIGCPLEHLDYASECVIEIFKYCSEAIKRKDEQIEGLTTNNDLLTKEVCFLKIACDRKEEEFFLIREVLKKLEEKLEKAKAEAVKEFAERFENELTKIEEFYIEEEYENFISANKVIALLDNLVKEMVGETDV
jgi:hypothetical protein